MTNFQEIIHTLQEKLPIWGAELVRSHLDQKQPYNVSFATDLDNPKHHKPEWHEWGILTHTKKVLEAFELECLSYLETWGWNNIETEWANEYYMKSSPSRYTHRELMTIAIILHDLGKFTNRHLSKIQTNTYTNYPDFSFGLHEVASERIIHSDLVRPTLIELGLHPEEVYYIGRLTALHYELSKIRERAKQSQEGFCTTYLMSQQYEKECRLLLRSHSPFAIELGIIYLADTLGKTSYRLTPEEIGQSGTETKVKTSLVEHAIDPRHLNSAITLQVGVLATKRYFDTVVKVKRPIM